MSGRRPAGSGVLVVWSQVRPADEDELNRWYTEEHLPERLAVPGFLGARRYAGPPADDGCRRYLALYELDDVAVLSSPAYRERFTNPTAWTRRVLGSFVRSGRRAYRVAGRSGDGLGGWLSVRNATDLPVPGANVVAARLLCSDEDTLVLTEVCTPPPAGDGWYQLLVCV